MSNNSLPEQYFLYWLQAMNPDERRMLSRYAALIARKDPKISTILAGGLDVWEHLLGEFYLPL